MRRTDDPVILLSGIDPDMMFIYFDLCRDKAVFARDLIGKLLPALSAEDLCEFIL